MEDDILMPPWSGPEPYFQFTPKQRRNVFVAHYEPSRVIDDKRQSSCTSVSSLNALNRIYPNAIEVTSPVSQVVRGGAIVVALMMGFFSISALFFLTKIIRNSYQLGWADAEPVVIVAMIILSVAFFFFGLVSVWLFRAPFIQPTDLPIIFNKRTRRISFMRMRLPNFLKFWAPLITEYKTHDWDTAKVRTYQVTGRLVGTSAVTTSTSGKLCLLWGNDPDEPRQFKDWVAVGFNKENEQLLRLWEHIRRYMEEGGPAFFLVRRCIEAFMTADGRRLSLSFLTTS